VSVAIQRYITQNNTPRSNKTAHKATPTIKDTLHTMNTTQTSKAISVTGPGVLWSCEMSKIPHCPRNRFTDGGKVVRKMSF
jgi:hypothetical protein